jgi:hypothetical protein
MKILDIPQSGKRGLTVSMPGRYGQVSRALVVPTNPRTTKQRGVRAVFASVAENWRAISEAQRQAWIAAAKGIQSKTRLGQSGPLTGSQLFLKVNALRLDLDFEVVEDPPVKPSFEANPVGSFTITNTGGVISLKLAQPTDFFGTQTGFVKAAAPRSAGREVCNDFRLLGAVPPAVQGSADITNLYKICYGSPAVGSKIFVQVFQYQDGDQDLPIEFTAVVPADG